MLPALAAALLLAGCREGSAEPPSLRAVEAFPGLSFDRPVEIGPYDDERLVIAQRPGLVELVSRDGAQREVFLDIRDRVDVDKGEGLLSVALDPEFESNGYVWAYYFTAGESKTVLSRFETDGDRVDPDSELVVLELEQPGYNQNGGAIRFGPDGMLYLSLGDGSASLDPYKNGQNLGTLLGAIIRIDVRAASGDEPYRVPDDNPFLHNPEARPEIWAYGVRNPWRIAFDPETGDLWGGDVGSTDYEEINRYEAGGNYGWNIREGPECLAGGNDCRSEGLTPPAAYYAQTDARCAVIGGLVYRDDALPGLDGFYLYADLCSGEIFALNVDEPDEPLVIGTVDGQVNSFGPDGRGGVLMTTEDGQVWRLEAD